MDFDFHAVDFRTSTRLERDVMHDSSPLAPFNKNVMSSTKPELLNVLQRRHEKDRAMHGHC